MSKSSQPPPLSDAQLAIMNIVWDRREATVGQVWRTISAERAVARNTVLALITRLEEKGWLSHRTEGNAFFYRATVPRKTTLRRMVRRLVDTAFEGSAEGLVLALLESRDLSAEEAARIRTMLGQARPSAKAKKGHKS